MKNIIKEEMERIEKENDPAFEEILAENEDIRWFL